MSGTVYTPAYPSQYKGIYFRYQPVEPVQCGFSGMWLLSDTEHGWGVCQDFNADEFRLDQCFEEFKKTLELVPVSSFTYTQHIAGSFEDGLQVCRLCGKVLADYTGSWATTDPTGRPASWPEGEIITQAGGFTMVGSPPPSAPHERCQRHFKKCTDV